MATAIASDPVAASRPSDDPWNPAPANGATTDPNVSERGVLNIALGSFLVSPQLPPPSNRQWNQNGRIQAFLSAGNPHPAGVIGSSRPVSRIDQIQSTMANKKQTLGDPFSRPINDDEDHVLSSRNGAVGMMNPSDHLFNLSEETAGYTLSSSMWATPNSRLPLTHLHNFNKNTVSHRPIADDETDFEQGARQNKTEKPESAFNSPDLSFSQEASAPSTTRSSLTAMDGCMRTKRTPLTGNFNGDKAQGELIGLGLKSTDYGSGPRGLGKENGENTWHLPLSFGEEAFYSKSNIIKPMNNGFTPPLREASPGLWRPPSAVERPSLSTSSPSNAGPLGTLGSPFTVPKYINELINQMMMRIDKLERTAAKQDVEITTLKSGSSSLNAQAVPLSNPLPNVSVNPGRSVLHHGRSALLPSGPVPSLNTHSGHIAPAPGLGPPPNFTTHPLQPQQLNLSNTPPGNFQEHMNNPNGSHIYVKHPSNFASRQYGPLDFAMGRSNSFNGNVAPVSQPSPINAQLPNSNFPNGLGGVNYRTLLAGDTDCDYEYFIRRITEHNDQQSSIFLQQKLKQSAVANSLVDEKIQNTITTSNINIPRVEITRLVIEYSLELMSNRFGNFLVSRAIEHATPEERMLLAEKIRGHIIALASDTFATHCLQKMIDVDDDENNKIRGLISQELLKKKETVTHKSAGHVWARLLSVGGSSSAMHLHASGLNIQKPNGLNKYGSGVGSPGELERNLNELLKGQWAKTAKDEVGSLIVQSVLENWSEAEKTGVIEELLADIYGCATQQWGNFVVLHLIEHSSGEVQRRLFERLMETQLACELSTDNFGAKAIEKVLKVSGMESAIVENYVRGICEFGHGRPALIEIACHQAGAQVLTLLFTSTPNPIRDLMISTVKEWSHDEVLESWEQDLVFGREDSSVGGTLSTSTKPWAVSTSWPAQLIEF